MNAERPAGGSLGQCRLCLKEDVELRKSHIIPEFNYGPCYDEKHRFIQLSTVGPKHKKLQQQGFRERLLCQNCETKLSRWENYAKKVLVDGGLESATKFRWGYEFSGVNYAIFKLYWMSLIWRMGVSSLEMFNCVSLGKMHEERLRKALMDEDPLSEHEYPVTLIGITLKGRFLSDFIVPPSMVKIDGHHCYRTVISGIFYNFTVGSHRQNPNVQQMSLNEQNIINIPILKIQDMPFLYDHFLQMSSVLQTRKIRLQILS